MPGLLHYWSAPSKESIHLMVLARALQRNPLALRFVCNHCRTQDEQFHRAILLLTNKITSFENFDANFPGFGGA